jgi:hypothetical protein
MANGWNILIKIIDVKKIKENKINWIISRGSLYKILILGINEKEILFSWSFKRINLIFDLQDQCFY